MSSAPRPTISPHPHVHAHRIEPAGTLLLTPPLSPSPPQSSPPFTPSSFPNTCVFSPFHTWFPLTISPLHATDHPPPPPPTLHFSSPNPFFVFHPFLPCGPSPPSGTSICISVSMRSSPRLALLAGAGAHAPAAAASSAGRRGAPPCSAARGRRKSGNPALKERKKMIKNAFRYRKIHGQT